jgi:hypothetical protein
MVYQLTDAGERVVVLAVIAALEDSEDYQAFEAAVIADYDAQSVVDIPIAACVCLEAKSETANISVPV